MCCLFDFEMLADAEIGVFSLLQWCFGIRSHVSLVGIDFSLTIPIMGLPHLLPPCYSLVSLAFLYFIATLNV